MAALELGVADVGGGVDEREHRARVGHRRRTRLGSTIAARQAALASSGSGGGTCMPVLEPVGLGVEEQALGLQRRGELARAAVATA